MKISHDKFKQWNFMTWQQQPPFLGMEAYQVKTLIIVENKNKNYKSKTYITIHE